MPSQKPRITVYTDEETNLKLAYIAKSENRSSSNYTEYLIKKDIKEFEKKYGTIQIEEKQVKEDNTGIKILKMVTGVTAGEKIGDIVVNEIHKRQEKNSDR